MRFLTKNEKIIFDNRVKDIINKKLCKFCLGKMKQDKKFYNKLRCSKAKWRIKKSYDKIFTKKPFFYSKIPCDVMLYTIKLFFTNLKLKHIVNLVSLNKNTVKDIFRNVLQNSKQIVKNDHFRIGGDNIIVEIDESLFGKRKFNRGRRRKAIWVVGAVERTPERKIKLCTVKRPNKTTLNNLINKWIDNRSILYSDCWKGYTEEKLFVKEHKTVNHSIEFVNINNNVHTNTIEGNWTAIKSVIPKRYRNNKHFSKWLYYFMFVRNNTDEPFTNYLKNLN